MTDKIRFFLTTDSASLSQSPLMNTFVFTNYWARFVIHKISRFAVHVLETECTIYFSGISSILFFYFQPSIHGDLTSAINSLKYRDPMKHIPILSFFFTTASNFASSAIFFTSLLRYSPRGNMHLWSGSWATWDMKNVWSLDWSMAFKSFTSEN